MGRPGIAGDFPQQRDIDLVQIVHETSRDLMLCAGKLRDGET
jgi:hypothetical protein